MAPSLPLDIQFASTVLFEAVRRRTSIDARYQHAVQLRDGMRQAIAAGAPPRDHYRYRWLVERGNKLIETLSVWSQEFDEQHPDDLSTVLDLYDVVNTARAHLVDQMEKLGMTLGPGDDAVAPAEPPPAEPPPASEE